MAEASREGRGELNPRAVAKLLNCWTCFHWRQKEAVRQVDNILLLGRSFLFLNIWLNREAGGWVVPGCGGSNSGLPCLLSPGHGRGGCVSWQDQPGDGGEAPGLRHGPGWAICWGTARVFPACTVCVCCEYMTGPQAPLPTVRSHDPSLGLSRLGFLLFRGSSQPPLWGRL